MKLFIKNKVSLRKLIYIRNELDRLGLQAVSLENNEINTNGDLTPAEYENLRQILLQAEVELIEDKKNILVQKIKNIIVDLVYHTDEPLVHNLSIHLSQMLHHDYTYMSNMFSEIQHTTIEKFYICHKIERVKELLLHEKMTLTEIAYKMHYSSLSHLSSQFRKVTGLTTSQFKQRSGKEKPPPEPPPDPTTDL